MEKLRKRVDVKLVTDKKKLMKLTSNPTFMTSKIFNEKLVAIHKIKETLMYDFHYNYIKKKKNIMITIKYYPQIQTD